MEAKRHKIGEASETRATKVTAPAPRAILALCLILPAPTIGILLPIWLEGTPWGALGWALAKVWVLGLPLVWRLGVDRRPISWSPPRRGGFALAVATALVMSAGIIAAYLMIGSRFIEPQDVRAMVVRLGLDDPRLYLAGAMYWILINSLAEEYVFRWFIVEKCGALMRPRLAILSSAAAFVLHHTIAMAVYMPWWINLIGSLAIFFAAAVWSWLYIRYQSIWPPYVSHAIVDVAIFALGAWILFV